MMTMIELARVSRRRILATKVIGPARPPTALSTTTGLRREPTCGAAHCQPLGFIAWGLWKAYNAEKYEGEAFNESKIIFNIMTTIQQCCWAHCGKKRMIMDEDMRTIGLQPSIRRRIFP
ncbi:hypothetical protein DM860_011430 [Cuscuta australis]|uniref:Uncharacterized protein n=1 Tax=Cuscuta australis TaxID=267555 RepID=A0A328DQB7_9ASTE|nr:hypothetical protein DM860_011430 [Cuscuta australis]